VPAYKMLLHPAEPAWTTEPRVLASSLQELGLLAPPRPLGEDVYYPTGEQFLHLVTFLGCSPSIELDPPADPAALAAASASGKFCHAFISRSPQPRLRADARTPALRCPACKRPLTDWPDLRNRWASALPDAPWRCGGCGHGLDILSFPFKKTAGIASIWLELRGIHPFEAVPAPALLDYLHNLADCPWRTIYLHE
jgi:hypothetical protein